MRLNICTKWSKCGKEDYALTGLYPPPRIYVGTKRWGLTIALGRAGKTQWFNPIGRRWTRKWFWFTLVPPHSWNFENGKLRQMKDPW
jgi:hypothetical protein